MIAAKAKEPGKAKVEAPGQKVKQQPASPQVPVVNPLWQQLALGVQAKLAVSAPDDPFEREADRVAERVMRMPAPQVQRTGAAPCPQCEEQQRLQRKPAAPHIASAGNKAAALQLLGAGQPLEPSVRTFFEPRLGRDLGDIRVHIDKHAASAARNVDALAFTIGRDVVFGAGEYRPNTNTGRRLLAHELTHVVQQSAGHTSSAVARQPAGAGFLQRKNDPKAPPCDTGCAQRWGQDTTCSFFGRIEPSPEAAIAPPGDVDNPQKPLICCNSWPLSLEVSARQEGLKGAASCTKAHAGEVATVTFAGKSADVLCTDTIPSAQFKPKPISSPTACMDKVMDKEKVGGKKVEVLEMSPFAMKFLSGQLDHALPVSVCYSGVKPDDLCPHTGGLPWKPKIEQCLSEGCRRPENPPTHDKSGWPIDEKHT